jgi:hypothetical protein
MNQTFSDHVGFVHLDFPVGISALMIPIGEVFAEQSKAEPLPGA